MLSRAAIAHALTNVDVAQVDLWSRDSLQTPDGRIVRVRDWARELGIQYAPRIVFFDADGEEVFRIEAYLRRFHVHGAIDYGVSGAYRRQPSCQRLLQRRTGILAERGIDVDLLEWDTLVRDYGNTAAGWRHKRSQSPDAGAPVRRRCRRTMALPDSEPGRARRTGCDPLLSNVQDSPIRILSAHYVAESPRYTVPRC